MEVLNPRVRLAWGVGAVVTAVVVGVVATVIDRFALGVGVWVGLAVAAVALALGVFFAVLRYRVWRFEVREDDLYLERGVLTRVNTVVPFVRVQHVDTQRGPVERTLGLASVVVYTAGSRGADVTIPGLTPERADDLQEQLRRLAIESERESDAV
ncbi:PH domain-containing protein [Halorussus sp. MSC15.2]|uniref:PH domain-containing protein n=1 Tax=Halorussus sp. MSC15.2 TaxID=2283638 RepID=UPI0013D68DAE|nr:PH domain-containing protein [Halorussus sp. MSC15.2]NEU56851.1 PH domain-containing protein [Halorussus sp. MSC15.2]